jgi:ribosomal-protein-alanine N-acetyltransferase
LKTEIITEIRQAELADLKRLCELETAIFSDPWSEEGIASAVLQGNVLVYAFEKNADEIAGYLIFAGDETEIDISVLAVDEKFRRQGIGRTLIEKIAEKFPKAALWLEVRERNENARSFYEKIGFLPKYHRRNYYQNPPDNAVIMAREPVH